MIQPLAITRADGLIAPAAHTGPDGVIAPLCAVDGVAPCCCNGQCPGPDAILCGDLTLSPETVFINGDLFAYICPQSGPAIFYYIDGLSLPPLNMVVSNGNPGSLILSGCANAAFTLRIEREGDPTENIFTTADYFYDIGFECSDGVIYVRSAQIIVGNFFNNPYPSVVPLRIFYFDALDDDNPYDNPAHPAEFRRYPKVTEAIPNIALPPQSVSSNCGSYIVHPFGYGGTLGFEFGSNCDSEQCNGGVIECSACNNKAEKYPILASDIPPWARSFFVGDRRYAIGGPLVDQEPRPVDSYSPDPCPPPSGRFAIATKCDPFTPGPATVIYEIDPALGAGNGAVRLVNSFPNPACPTRTCTEIIQYRPTTEPSDGPADLRTAHLNGTACALPYQVTCQSCPSDPFPGDPVTRPRSTTPQSPQDQIRAQYGCANCGDPGLDGIL